MWYGNKDKGLAWAGKVPEWRWKLRWALVQFSVKSIKRKEKAARCRSAAHFTAMSTAPSRSSTVCTKQAVCLVSVCKASGERQEKPR